MLVACDSNDDDAMHDDTDDDDGMDDDDDDDDDEGMDNDDDNGGGHMCIISHKNPLEWPQSRTRERGRESTQISGAAYGCSVNERTFHMTPAHATTLGFHFIVFPPRIRWVWRLGRASTALYPGESNWTAGTTLHCEAQFGCGGLRSTRQGETPTPGPLHTLWMDVSAK